MSANLADFSGPLLERRIPSGVRVSQCCRVIFTHSVFQIRYGNHGVKIKQLYQIQTAFDGQNIFRFQIKVQEARIMNVFEYSCRAQHQGNAVMQGFKLHIRKGLPVQPGRHNIDCSIFLIQIRSIDNRIGQSSLHKQLMIFLVCICYAPLCRFKRSAVLLLRLK